MSQNDWLQTEKPYLNYHHDGLLDIFMGLGAIMVGALLLWDAAAYVGILFVLFYGLSMVAKEWVTAPRLRVEELTAVNAGQQQRAKFIGLSVTLVLGVAIFLLTMLVLNEQAPAWLIVGLRSAMPFIILLVIVGAMAFMGYLMQVRRLIGYALLILAVATTYFLWPLPIYSYAFVVGAVMLTVGLGLLWQFLQTHPRQPKAV